MLNYNNAFIVYSASLKLDLPMSNIFRIEFQSLNICRHINKQWAQMLITLSIDLHDWTQIRNLWDPKSWVR